MSWLSASTYIFSIVMIKSSLLLRYLRTFIYNETFQISLRAVLGLIINGYGFVITFYFFKITLLLCKWKNVTLLWDLSTCVCHIHLDDFENWVSVSSFTILWDLIVIFFSIRIVWNLDMGHQHNIAVIMLIGAGTLYKDICSDRQKSHKHSLRVTVISTIRFA